MKLGMRISAMLMSFSFVSFVQAAPTVTEFETDLQMGVLILRNALNKPVAYAITSSLDGQVSQVSRDLQVKIRSIRGEMSLGGIVEAGKTAHISSNITIGGNGFWGSSIELVLTLVRSQTRVQPFDKPLNVVGAYIIGMKQNEFTLTQEAATSKN